MSVYIRLGLTVRYVFRAHQGLVFFSLVLGLRLPITLLLGIKIRDYR